MNASYDILEDWLQTQRLMLSRLDLPRMSDLERRVERDREAGTGENSPLDDN